MPTYGLICYDSSGTMLFDSSTTRLARILDIRILSSGSTDGYDLLIGLWPGSSATLLARIKHFCFPTNSTQLPITASASCVFESSGLKYVHIVPYRPTVTHDGIQTFDYGETVIATIMR